MESRTHGVQIQQEWFAIPSCRKESLNEMDSGAAEHFRGSRAPGGVGRRSSRARVATLWLASHMRLLDA